MSEEWRDEVRLWRNAQIREENLRKELQRQLADARQQNERLREVGEKIVNRLAPYKDRPGADPLYEELVAALRTEQGEGK